jgi:hypothetical protein
LFAAAVTLGVAGLGTSWSDHNTAGVLVDVVLGTLACLALWLRRTHPVGVGALAVSAGAVSSLASGAAPFALFSVAVRASRRALVVLAALAVVAVAIFPAIYPSTGRYEEQFLFGLLVVVVAIGWGCSPASAMSSSSRSATVRSGWNQSSSCVSRRPARPSAVGSRARCTTCWRIASPC